MNHKPSSLPNINQAIEGFLYFKIAEGLSDSTIVSYRHDLEIWTNREDIIDLESIKPIDLVHHLAWLRTEYKPKRLNLDPSPLSGKTLRNHWSTFKAFFRWVNLEYGVSNPMGQVPCPKFNSPPIKPMSPDEIKLLIKACKYRRPANTKNRAKFTMKRPTSRRDEAVILLLLDTGVRAAEFCALCIEDLDLKSGKLEIKHGPKGGAKGGRGRSVYLGKVTKKTLWRYLETHEYRETPEAPLFLSYRGGRMTPNGLRHLVMTCPPKTGPEVKLGSVIQGGRLYGKETILSRTDHPKATRSRGDVSSGANRLADKPLAGD